MEEGVDELSIRLDLGEVDDSKSAITHVSVEFSSSSLARFG